MRKKAQLIIALDVDTLKQAKKIVDTLYPRVKIFKVGSQLFTGCGARVIEYVNSRGAKVFLDLKYFDIPNTVARAVEQAVRLKVKMLTLHISGGPEMLEAAVKAAGQQARKLKIRKPLLIGVTVLTSCAAKPKEVMDLARLGISCGLDGIVCSAREVGLLKKKISGKFIAVTPGIRSNTAGGDDQKRTATAQEAIAAGSDYLVVGRPILEAPDPIKAIAQFS